MANTINNVIKKIKAKLGFHGVSNSDVLKAGNTAYDGVFNNAAFPNTPFPLPVFRQGSAANQSLGSEDTFRRFALVLQLRCWKPAQGTTLCQLQHRFHAFLGKARVP